MTQKYCCVFVVKICIIFVSGFVVICRLMSKLQLLAGKCQSAYIDR